MTETGTDPVVVGVDGSESSLVALRWAAADAIRRQAPLRVLVARAPAADYPHDSPAHVALLEQALQARAHTVEIAAEEVLAAVPDLPADIVVVVGNSSFLLLDAAETAALVVIGSRGLGGWRGALAGSTGAQLAGHTRCPLVVVRDLPSERTGVVVVGVDGTSSGAAVDYAVAHAARTGARVRAVYCWSATPFGGTDPDVDLDLDLDRAPDYREVLDQALDPLRSRFPDLPIESEVRYGQATTVLAAEAEHADLLVVGSRGRGGFVTLVLGSVALSLLQAVRGPVAVVAPPR